MSAARFNVGDRVRVSVLSDTIATVTTCDPLGGCIVVIDNGNRYVVVREEYCELAPQRYTVELRVPKVGERYAYGDEILTAGHAEFERKRFVIVEDAS